MSSFIWKDLREIILALLAVRWLHQETIMTGTGCKGQEILKQMHFK